MWQRPLAAEHNPAGQISWNSEKKKQKTQSEVMGGLMGKRPHAVLGLRLRNTTSTFLAQLVCKTKEKEI